MTRDYDRFHFELVYSSDADPWNEASEYEQTKRSRTLALLRGRQFRRALEMGCGTGALTTLLAPFVRELVAADISYAALDRTRERCAKLDNISLVRLDLVEDHLPGSFDLVVCSEVLYY